MLLRQLEYFVALAREGHFARAAEVCYVSQPALSEAIGKLERELKVPLVRRGHNFEGLTPEGEGLLPWARRMLADQEGMLQEAEALRAGIAGDLRLGVVPGAASTAALLLDPLCAAHPLLRLQVETSLRSAEIAERVRRFELDAGIVYADGDYLDGLEQAPLYTEREVLVIGESLLAAETLDAEGAGNVGWAEAIKLPLCVLNSGMRGRQLLDRAFAEEGLALQPRIETDSVVTLLALVRSGRWASVIPAAWLRALPLPPSVRVLELRPPLEARVTLVTSAVRPVSALSRAVVEAAGRADLGRVLAGGEPGSGR